MVGKCCARAMISALPAFIRSLGTQAQAVPPCSQGDGSPVLVSFEAPPPRFVMGAVESSTDL